MELKSQLSKRGLLSRLARLRKLTLTFAVCAPLQCHDLRTAIRDLGFQEVIPPSTFSGPGSVIYIRDTHPLRTGVICPPSESLGPLFKPRESETQQSSFSKTKRKHFALGADLLSQIKTDIGTHYIKSVTVTLTNPKIFIVADTDVLMHMHARSEICRRAIAKRRAANQFRISMISETLQGDVTYNVTWETGVHLTAEAKVDVLTNLKAKLKLLDGDIKGNAIVGKALVWGIVDDRWLAESADQDPEAQAVPLPPSQRVNVTTSLQGLPLEEIDEEAATIIVNDVKGTDDDGL